MFQKVAKSKKLPKFVKTNLPTIAGLAVVWLITGIWHGTKKMDSDHTITVSAPEGAEVYLDNVYKGLAPCTFTKVIGSQTITLRKDGYTTKSYSVDVLDDDQDVKFSFSDLGVKEEAAETTATPAP